MYTSFFHEKAFLAMLHEQWANWQNHKRFYPNSVVWWGRYIKGQIRKILIGEGTTRNQDRNRLENFYYDAICTALKDANPKAVTYATLDALIAKILRLSRATQASFSRHR
jgi:hypothetical protein